jgi:hypothetical protein
LNLAANLLPDCLANLLPTENMKLQRRAFKDYRIRVRGHNTGSPSLLFPGQLWSPRPEGALFMMTKIYIAIATPGGQWLLENLSSIYLSYYRTTANVSYTVNIQTPLFQRVSGTLHPEIVCHILGLRHPLGRPGV